MATGKTDAAWREPAERDPAHRTAARWFARLQDREVTVEEMLAWQHWMNTDDRHAQAFNRIEEAWNVAHTLSPERIEAVAATINPPTKRIFQRPLPMALAASVLVAFLVSGWVLLRPESGLLETKVGENRVLRLEDGSQVTLGGDTEIEVRFSSRERGLVLQRGEAFFTVAKEAARPFRVYAGNTTVTAVGTAFNVRRNEARIVVAVVEGRVTVTPARQDDSPAPLNLQAGDRTVIAEAGTVQTTRLPDPEVETAWRQGVLHFQDEPLHHVIADVNRYAPKPIVLGDRAIGELRVTGSVMEHKIGEWVESLEGAFSLQAMEDSARIVLMPRHAPSN